MGGLCYGDTLCACVGAGEVGRVSILFRYQLLRVSCLQYVWLVSCLLIVLSYVSSVCTAVCWVQWHLAFYAVYVETLLGCLVELDGRFVLSYFAVECRLYGKKRSP